MLRQISESVNLNDPEVLKDFCLSKEEFEKIRPDKVKKRGSFKKKIYLERETT